MNDRIDWTTTDGCQLCWEHGPFLPMEQFTHDVHYALHVVAAVILRAATAMGQDDFVLAGPSEGAGK